MSGNSKVAVIAAALGAAAAGLVWYATSAGASESEAVPQTSSTGDESKSGDGGSGDGRGEDGGQVKTRTRRSSSAGSIVREERQRSSSWADPLYAREERPTSVVDDMLAKARHQVAVFQRQAAQLLMPIVHKQTKTSAGTAAAPHTPSEATRSAVLTLMASSSEHGVHWMLSAVADGLDLATLISTFRRLSARGRPQGAQGHTIDVDLPRTFPSDPMFADGGKKLAALRTVLYAISHHVDSGYTQGMNFVAGHLLRHTSPELAFALLVHIVSQARLGSVEVYSPTADGTADITNQLKHLVQAHLSADVSALLERINFDYNLLMKWYIGLFASMLPDGAALNDVWDVVFSFGWKAVLYAIVAMLQVVFVHVQNGHYKVDGVVVDDLTALSFEQTYALLESFGKRTRSGTGSNSVLGGGAGAAAGGSTASASVLGVEAPANLGKFAVKLLMKDN